MAAENLFLIGFMGTGKTTVAAWLSARLGWSLVEMDDLLENQEGQRISQVFADRGEDYFRQQESRLLERICQGQRQVVSCGGGVPLKEENRVLLGRFGRAVWLTASPETILERVKRDENRPLLQERKTPESIAALLESRQEAYQQAAYWRVDTEGKTIPRIGEEILRRMEEDPSFEKKE